ncbi:ABC transporter permease [Deinococcus sp. HMF7604]|uniref:ABC transporter permease n=1 Tax=Deinococcus betulae TaxID=2873312 RepID=UPI001CCFBB04|nr:ABC transporter permease [Deinococcus betulae]
MTTTVPVVQKRVRVQGQSQFSVAWSQFRKNRLAQIGGSLLILLYLMALFAPFLAPSGLSNYSTSNITRFHPPTPIQFRDAQTGAFGRPFVYKYTQQLNPDTFVNEYRPSAEKCPIYFGVRGDSYRILGLIPGNLHLFGTGNSDCNVYLFGAEDLGRDLLSRTLYASQISLTIGLAAVIITTLIGLFMGAAAAYFGGIVDTIIMRFVEVLSSIPTLFLLLLLRSIFPKEINPIFALYVILGILAFIGWGGLARTTRGQLLSVREQDFVSAAKSLGASDNRIMWRHMLPTMTTYVIVTTSLAIPGYILLESGLSFLGIGAVEPYASWGSLLKLAQDGGLSSLNIRPWVLIPGFFIVFTVMCFQLLGDGLRDAFDPRKRS